MTWDRLNRDDIWGWVLIALGIASLWWKPFDKLDAMLKGESETVLTMALFIGAIVLVLIALHGDASLKAIAVFWIVSP
jgi:hypothetical protein